MGGKQELLVFAHRRKSVLTIDPTDPHGRVKRVLDVAEDTE